MEARRTLSYKRRDTRNPLVLRKYAAKGISHKSRALCRRSLRRIYFHGKLVSFCDRHHALGNNKEQHPTENHHSHSHAERQPGITETALEQPRISILQIIQRFLSGLLRRCRRCLHSKSSLYEPELQIRSEQQRDGKRHSEDYEHRPWESLHKVRHIPLHCKQERKERKTDGQCGRKNGHEELARRRNSGLPSRHPATKFFHIVVYNHHGIIHHHTERNDKGSKCHGIQLHAEHEEQSDGSEYSNRNSHG